MDHLSIEIPTPRDFVSENLQTEPNYFSNEEIKSSRDNQNEMASTKNVRFCPELKVLVWFLVQKIKFFDKERALVSPKSDIIKTEPSNYRSFSTGRQIPISSILKSSKHLYKKERPVEILNPSRMSSSVTSTANSFDEKPVEYQLSPKIFMIDSVKAKRYSRTDFERNLKILSQSKTSKFQDSEFPPNLSSLVYVPKKLPNPLYKEIIWARIHELYTNPKPFLNEEIPFFEEFQITSPDFITALYSISQEEGMVKRLFGNQEISRKGIYYVKVKLKLK